MVALLIFLPLCLLKKLGLLKYTAFISFLSTIYAVCMVRACCLDSLNHELIIQLQVVYVATIPHDELVAKGVLTPKDEQTASSFDLCYVYNITF